MTNKQILMAHGSGGKHSNDLISQIFIPAFNLDSNALHDGASFIIGNENLAISTDSYVVKPLIFPGGDIGKLAIYGTINDLAMCGAKPLYLSAGFILEEGLEIDILKKIVASMKEACAKVDVKLITGDTKVIERSSQDGMYINSTGIGKLLVHNIMPNSIKNGDLILLNGDIGKHGMSIMSVREGLSFASEIKSDVCELWSLVEKLLLSQIDIHCLRDLTRGGLATALVDLVEHRNDISIEIDESAIMIDDDVSGAIELLGMDPLYVACEGRMIIILNPNHADIALDIISSCGFNPHIIGEVIDKQATPVKAKTIIGTYRVIERLPDDQLPRIC